MSLTSYFGIDVLDAVTNTIDDLINTLRGHKLVHGDNVGAIIVRQDGEGIFNLPCDLTDLRENPNLFDVTVYGNGEDEEKIYRSPEGLLVNALRKARITARTKLDSGVVAASHPHLLEPGDFPYAGAVLRNGLIVSLSGFKAPEDHMTSEIIASIVTHALGEVARHAVDLSMSRSPVLKSTWKYLDGNLLNAKPDYEKDEVG